MKHYETVKVEIADKVAKVLLTPQRTLNAGIVGKSAQFIAELAGVSIPAGTRCLLADCGGVGRDHPWSIEKLSPTQREVFTLRVQQGLSYKEIAEVVGSTEGAARVHYHNAIRTVKEFLSDE